MNPWYNQMTLTGGLAILSTTSGYATSTLSYFESATAQVALSGTSVGTTITLAFTRVGNDVTMSWTNFSGTVGSGGSAITSAAAVPARFSPLSTVQTPIVVTGNGSAVATIGQLQVTSAGNLTFYYQNAAVFPSATMGLNYGSASWNTNF